MSWGWSTDKNTSAGGHTYDRTTGTWQGETQGSFGDNSNWGAPVGAPTRVIHDANGPVGHETAQSGLFVTDGGKLVTTNSGGGTTGPGTDAVATSWGGGDGVDGPGAPAGAAGVSASAGPGNAVVPGAGDLKPKLKATHTQLKLGNVNVVHDAGYSDAGEAEERWGDGEFGSPSFFYNWSVAIADVKASASTAYLNSPFAGVTPAQRKANAEAIQDFLFAPTPALVNGGLPKQEPVDWGR